MTKNLPPHLAMEHTRRCVLKARGPAQLEVALLKVLNPLQAYKSARRVRLSIFRMMNHLMKQHDLMCRTDERLAKRVIAERSKGE